MDSVLWKRLTTAAGMVVMLSHHALTSPSPSPQPMRDIRLGLEVVPLSEGEIPEEVISSVSSEKIRVLRVRVTNQEDLPVRLLWGDFLVRDPESGRWVGGWWGDEMGNLGKMELLAGVPPSGKPSFIPPQTTLEYLLADPWPTSADGMEYKFALLVSLPSGETTMFETPSRHAATVAVPRSGVELVAAGVSSAVGKLVSPDPTEPPAEPGALGVTLVHTPVGPVEVGKNAQLKAAIGEWSPPPSSGELFHVYRTELVNNTQSPLRLVMMESATSSGTKWLTGHLRPPVMGPSEISASCYVEKVASAAVPTTEKMSDGWLLPGDRVIFPAMWHAADPSGDPSSARWRSVLVDKEGLPVYAEGVTPPDIPLVPVFPDGEPSPSHGKPK